MTDIAFSLEPSVICCCLCNPGTEENFLLRVGAIAPQAREEKNGLPLQNG